MFNKATILLSLLTVSMVSAPALAQVEFSATMVQQMPERPTMETRIYVGDKTMRSELNSPNGPRVTIVDMNKGAAWMLNPDRLEYVQFDTGNNAEAMQTRPPLPDDPDSPCNLGILRCTKIGMEEINGRMAEKWEMTAGQGSTAHHTVVWIDKKLRMPIRQEMPGGVVNELRDIQEGEQASTLFTIPADYKKINLPAELQSQGR